MPATPAKGEEQLHYDLHVKRQHLLMCRNLNISIFEPEDEGSNSSKAWKNRLAEFHRLCRYIKIMGAKDKKDKKDALLIYG